MELTKKKEKLFRAVLALILVIVSIFAAFALYASDYYKAQSYAVECLYGNDAVSFSYVNKDAISLRPSDGKSTVGLIFYPGGKVEYTAYAPLMLSLAEMGITVVTVKMPFNLAVLNVNAAESVFDEYPAITDWYIGGHSLGGSMAASYASKHLEKLRGVILLGAYSTADLKESGLKVLSIYGELDGVMNKEKYEKYLTNLPSDLEEKIIFGGNHAYFGDYGVQEGDNPATITQKEQVSVTARYIFEFTKS